MKRHAYALAAVMLGVILTGTVQAAPVQNADQAFSIVMESILNNDAGDRVVYTAEKALPAGSELIARKRVVATLATEQWFVFIDEVPRANWAHPCKYVLVSPADGQTTVIEHNWPPSQILELKRMVGPDLFAGKNIRPPVMESIASPNSKSAEHQWAVILSGGYDSSNNHVRYWNDCSSIYCTLTEVYGYLDDHIIVAISDGTNPAVDQSNGQNSPVDLDGDGDADTMYSCTRSSLTTLFGDLSTTLGPQDSLFVFTTDHGSDESGYDTIMNLWAGEELRDDEFAAYLNAIPCREIVCTLEPCFSGGFVDDVVNMSSSTARVISTAANHLESSWAMGPDYVYDEYVFYWTAAVRGEDVYGNPVDADYNNDDIVTMDEAYQFAESHDTADEHPQYGESPAGYGATLSLFGSGPTSEGEISLNKNVYNCDDTLQIIVQDLDLQGSEDLEIDVISSTETLGETVTLVESDPGYFSGTISATTGTPAADGILQIAPGDTITASYFDENYGGQGTMTVTDTASVDCTSPIISNIMLTDETFESMVIHWTTDEPATSVVRYGMDVSLGFVVEDTEKVTDHMIVLTGLNDCTTYYFLVESADEAGNTAVDDNSGAMHQFQTWELIAMINEPLDENPNWTTEGQWAFGTPAGSSGDPSSGYTGTNIYGYNLSGAYPNNLPETHLTTPGFDCSEASGTILSFWRWLGIESSSYDHAYVKVSTNGTTWTTIWSHEESSFTDPDWVYCEYDISAIADGQPTVYIRWTMGTTDYSVTYCGWNIDDIRVYTSRPCESATPTPLPTFTPCLNNGDVDGNGSLTPADALASFQIYLGVIPDPTEQELCCADCNGNAVVTPEDALCVFTHYLSGACNCADPMDTAKSAAAAGLLSSRKSIHSLQDGLISVSTTLSRTGFVNFTLDLQSGKTPVDAFGLKLFIPGLPETARVTFGSMLADWDMLGWHQDVNSLTIGGFNPFNEIAPYSTGELAVISVPAQDANALLKRLDQIAIMELIDGFNDWNIAINTGSLIHSR